MYIDFSSVAKIAGFLKLFKPCIPYLPRIDPQFWAITSIVYEDRDYVSYILSNALVSYQLRIPGEKYWLGFSEKILRDKPGNDQLINWFREFLLEYNPLYINSKLSRIKRFYNSTLHKQLVADPTRYCRDLSLLWDELKRLYRDPYAKTVVFSVKMYYYYCLARGFETPVDYNIVFPVDRRNALLTLKLGLIKECGDKVMRKCVEKLMGSMRNMVIKTWDLVARVSGIPPLILDTITWALLGTRDDLRERLRGLENIRLCWENVLRNTSVFHELIK